MIAMEEGLAYLGQLRVLYVEDDVDAREQLAQFLSWRAKEVIQAGDGLAGLAAFREHHPDLVITDIHMPRMDGLSMAAEIRVLAPGIPILVTTAFEQSSYLIRAIEVGIDHYVLKPVDTDALERNLATCARHLLGEQELQRQRQREEENQRLRHQEAIGLLAQGLAHDFNNLLQAIMGWVSLARLQAEPHGKVAQALSHAEQSSGQAELLAARLRLIGESTDLLDHHGDVGPLLRSTLEEVFRDCPGRLDFATEVPAVPVKFNAPHLAQLFAHLGRNAMEAMGDEGTFRIQAEAAQCAEDALHTQAPGPNLHLAFTDSGPGIAPELLPRIFDPYFTTKRSFSQKGLGLGLTLCQAIAKHHGGTLRVDSPPGEGATFHLYLPIQPQA